MRIAILTQYHPGRAGDVTLRWISSANERGVEIRYYSGIPFNDVGRPASRVKVDQRSEPVAAVRYPYYYSHDSSAVRRFLTYGTFAARSSVAFRDLRWADVVLAYGSPATALSAAMLARRFGGVPYVMMVQDVWPDSIFATGFVRDGRARRLAEASVGRFVSAAYRGASGVTALSPGMRDLLVSRGVDPAKAHVLYNWAADERVVPARVRGAGEPLHLMFAGNMGPGQDLGNVLRALALLPPGVARLSLVGGGADVPRLEGLVAELGLGDRVEFVARVPQEDMPRVQVTADLHLVSLADADVFRVTLPSKLPTLMAMGLPVLATAPGEVGQIVTRAGCGLSAAPGDPVALAEVVRAAAAMPPADLAAMGARGAEVYHRDMSFEAGSAKLWDILFAAAAQAPGQGPRHSGARPA